MVSGCLMDSSDEREDSFYLCGEFNEIGTHIKRMNGIHQQSISSLIYNLLLMEPLRKQRTMTTTLHLQEHHH